MAQIARKVRFFKDLEAKIKDLRLKSAISALQFVLYGQFVPKTWCFLKITRLCATAGTRPRRRAGQHNRMPPPPAGSVSSAPQDWSAANGWGGRRDACNLGQILYNK